MVRFWVICMLLAIGERADAGGLVINGSSPRSIGRAGTGVVGDDGSGALLANPSAMARREGVRAQLGLAFVDDEMSWASTTDGAPVARDQAPSNVAPHAAAFGSIGEWVIGLGVMTTSVSDRALRPPRDIPDPNEIGVAFEYRYLGITGAVRRDTVTLGVARRLGDAVAIGAAFAASRVQLAEVRRMWAGFSGRDMLGSPRQDVEVAFTGEDRFVPSFVAGVLLAPENTDLELAASVSVEARARIVASVFADGTRQGGPSAFVDDAAIAYLNLEPPVITRAGARYLGNRFVVELGGEIAFIDPKANDRSWDVFGMRVGDTSPIDVQVDHVPSRVSMRTHGSVRTGVDVEVSKGFLWLTGGYAYSVGSVNRAKQSPSFGDLGGHTFALGIEGTSGGFTLTLGWSRTWSVARRVLDSTYRLDNPFNAGDRVIPGGTYDGSIDRVGIVLDAQFGD